MSAALTAGGIAVVDEYLPLPRVRSLIECAALRRARGDFAVARVGADRRLLRDEEIRGDSTCWLAEPLHAQERSLLDDLDQLRIELNREALLGVHDLEIHYAWYPPGAAYVRHLDQLQNHRHRVVSLVLYLNETWRAGDGGELRIWEGCGHRDIEPVAGRLVCFLSGDLEHAVLATSRDRLSVSGWMRRRH